MNHIQEIKRWFELAAQSLQAITSASKLAVTMKKCQKWPTQSMHRSSLQHQRQASPQLLWYSYAPLVKQYR